MKAQLLIQAGANVLFEGAVTYDPWTGEITGDTTLSEDAINDLIALSTAGGVDTEAYWLAVARFMDHAKGLGNFSGTEDGWMDDAISTADAGLSWDDIKDAYSFVNVGITDSGTSGNDTLNGTAYNDTLAGYDGNDTLNGGDGNDNLNGQAGNDILNGGHGGNLLFGGTGDDTYVYGGGSDVIEEYAGDGNDTILLPDGVTPGDLTFQHLGDYSLLIDIAGQGTIEITFQLNFGSSFQVETLQFYDPGDGTIDLTDLDSLLTYGTDASETLNGVTNAGDGIDIMYGFAGNDTLNANAGDDILDGGAGNDELYGGDGDDTYIASPGFDLIVEAGGTNDIIIIPEAFTADDVHFFHSGTNNNLIVQIAGLGQVEIYNQFYYAGGAIEEIHFANGVDDDIVLAGQSYETFGTASGDTLSGDLYGADTADVIYGLEGDDTLSGGAGDDHLHGGAGNDTLNGEYGDDTYYYEGGVDIINEYFMTSTGDRLVLPEGISPEDITLVADPTTGHLHVKDNGTTIVTVYYGLAYPIEYIEFHDSTVWDVTDIPYEIYGTSSGETMYGTGGWHLKDSLFGLGGNDTLNGGDDDDILNGGAGNDTLNGGDGSDTASYRDAASGATVNLSSGTASDGDGGTDTLSSIENAIGSAYADTITGSSGNNILTGLAGDDSLTGGDGDDTLYGGTGDDIYYFTSGNDVIDEQESGDDEDVIALPNGVDVGDILLLRYMTSPADLLIRIDDSNPSDSVYLGYITVKDQFLHVDSQVEVLRFYPNFDADLTSLQVSTIGTGGDDTIYGITTGASPNDTILGLDDADVIYAGDGDDIVLGGTGNDTLFGQDGGDALLGQEGDDILYGNGGADYLFGDDSTTVAYGGNDTLYGGDGADWLEGGKGNDILSGDAGNDVILGQEGADTLYGGAGADAMAGGDGNDILYGGDGADTLYGEAGADTFGFEAANAFNNVDQIMDFSTAQGDRLDISDILDGYYNPGTDVITDFVQITTSGSNSIVSVDQNGGANNFVQIATILGVTGLTDEAALVSNGNLVVV